MAPSTHGAWTPKTAEGCGVARSESVSGVAAGGHDERGWPMPTTKSAQVTDVEFCSCTNDELEAGKTCGLPQCPNHTEED